MRRSLVSRIAAVAIATLAGFSAPGSALAHGHAHHDADHLEYHHDGDHALSPAMADELHDVPRSSVHAAGESMDHAHPPLAQARATKMDAPLFFLPPIAVAVPSEIVRLRPASLQLTAVPPRAGPATAPPRQPRAPPLG